MDLIIANIMTLIPIVFLFFLILYYVVKNAVRNGIIEAWKNISMKKEDKE